MRKKPDEVAEELRQEILAEYRRRDQDDLLAVLSTVEGRRLWSRIIGHTKWFDAPMIYGNKRDDIEVGRRSIGGDLYAMAAQELGLKGLELIQLAQREYVATQIEQQTLIDIKLKLLKEETPT